MFERRAFTTEPVVQHQGIFRKQLSLFEGVALLISGTIGAGVLGIPFAVAQSGIVIGVLYIVVLGSLMIGLNLMLGQVTVETGKTFQLVGLAETYLGIWGKRLMAFVVYAMLFGILVVYIIGEGQTLSVLVGGDPFRWSMIFFVVAGTLVVCGLRTVKTIELYLTAVILAVVLLIAALGSPHIDVSTFSYANLAYALLPYGVVLFALHGTTTIPEMHALLKGKDAVFNKAIVIGGIIVMCVYVLFAIVVVGITGQATTEIATIGLGNTLGRTMFIFGNVFAFFAMATSFLLTGVALQDSLAWDYHLSRARAKVLALGIPLAIFVLGIREFIAAIDIVGGIFGSIEMLLILLIYWRAKQTTGMRTRRDQVALLGVVLAIVFTAGAVYSVWHLL